MRAAAFGLIALTSCSAITSFEGFVGQASGDGGSSQILDGSHDATNVDAAACDLSAPFGAPVIVPGLNTSSSEGSARFTPDELTVYFESDRPGGVGGFDIYVATRASRDAAFGTATNLTTVNTANDDFDPTLSDDGLTLIVSQPNPSDAYSLFAWTRASTNDAFTTSIELTQLESQGASLFQPYLGEHDQVLCFNADNSGIECASRAADGGFSAPAFLSELAGDPIFPVLSADGLTLYFTNGGVIVSTRPTTADAFSAGAHLTQLDSFSSNEGSDWLSPDGCRLYLEGVEASGVGANDIYVATRPQ